MGLTPHCRALECTGPTEMPQSALGFPPLTGMAFFCFFNSVLSTPQRTSALWWVRRKLCLEPGVVCPSELKKSFTLLPWRSCAQLGSPGECVALG